MSPHPGLRATVEKVGCEVCTCEETEDHGAQQGSTLKLCLIPGKTGPSTPSDGLEGLTVPTSPQQFI